jgi:hypothetical protein
MKGVSEEIAVISDELVKIPMPGKAESLNVAIAHGIIAFEAVRQRRNLVLLLVNSFMLCYNTCKPYGKGRGPMLTADFFWNIFEVTGSITAYLIYRELLLS